VLWAVKQIPRRLEIETNVEAHPGHNARKRGGIANRAIHGVSAGVIATMLSIAGNLLLLPIYLRHWSVTVYGEWMALYSAVNYLGALDFGLTTAATNAATYAYAAQDWQGFRRIQGTAWALSIGVAILAVLVSAVILTCFSIHSWLGLKVMSSHDSRLVFGGLSLTFLISIPSRQLGSTYIALGEFAKYQWIYNAGQILTLAATGTALLLGVNPVGLSSVIAITALVLLGATYGLIWLRDQKLIPRLCDASWGIARSLARPSGQFLLQMFANMLALQGPVIIISRAFGGQGVAVFTTTRTVSNVVRGILTIFRAPLRPEYAAAYAESTKDRLRSLFRIFLAIDTTIAVSLMAGIWTGGTWLIRIWSHGQIAPDILLLHLLLVCSLLEGFLWMLASAGNAANRFHGVSLGFLAYALVSLILAMFFVRHWGPSAVPASAILSLLVLMLPVALRNAHSEVDLPLRTLIGEICIPFAAIAALSIVTSVGVMSLRIVPEWLAASISALTACAVSIIAASLTMLPSADRRMLLNSMARWKGDRKSDA
jgi:O-antigen/teichoic acid export membrane protein